jgi:hypothetical protein
MRRRGGSTWVLARAPRARRRNRLVDFASACNALHSIALFRRGSVSRRLSRCDAAVQGEVMPLAHRLGSMFSSALGATLLGSSAFAQSVIADLRTGVANDGAFIVSGGSDEDYVITSGPFLQGPFSAPCDRRRIAVGPGRAVRFSAIRRIRPSCGPPLTPIDAGDRPRAARCLGPGPTTTHAPQ